MNATPRSVVTLRASVEAVAFVRCEPRLEGLVSVPMWSVVRENPPSFGILRNEAVTGLSLGPVSDGAGPASRTDPAFCNESG